MNDPRMEAASLLCYVLARHRAYLIAHAGEVVSPVELGKFEELVLRRSRREPLQYITGYQEFYGFDFKVTPEVLVPRPETEVLVTTALELAREQQAGLICDVGTGSGCIIVSLLRMLSEARGVALDISPPALAVAVRNARHNNVADRIQFVASDCLSALDQKRAQFDLIVSNPPYVAPSELPGLQPEVRDYEPLLALVPWGNTAAADGLAMVRRLLAEAHLFLIQGGYLVMEIGYDQQQEVKKAVSSSFWEFCGFRPDLQDIERIVVVKKKQET